MIDYKKFEGKNPFSRPWMYNNCAAHALPSGSPLKGLIAGGLTGGMEVFLSYPTEFVKTKLQLDESSARTGQKRKYSGFIDVVRQTIKEKGFFGLYRGLSVLLVFSIPKVAIRFGSFELFKSMLIDENGNLRPSTRVLSGLGAGVSEAILAVTPMETIKTKFIHDQQRKVPQYKGLVNGIATIIKAEGMKGVYQGVVPTILRQGSNQAIRFSVMETLKNHYRGGDPTLPIPTVVIGCFAVIAATCSVLGNTPIDVVKTRMQGLEAAKYKNTLDCAKQIFKHEGPLAFYKGTQARLLRVCIDVCFVFMMYENVMALFNKVWP